MKYEQNASQRLKLQHTFYLSITVKILGVIGKNIVSISSIENEFYKKFYHPSNASLKAGPFRVRWGGSDEDRKGEPLSGIGREV